jgi:hypothetical protein
MVDMFDFIPKEHFTRSLKYCATSHAVKSSGIQQHQITGRRAPMIVPYQMMKALSVLVKPFDFLLLESYTSEGDNSKAKRELGYNPRPLREGWEETFNHTQIARMK